MSELNFGYQRPGYLADLPTALPASTFDPDAMRKSIIGAYKEGVDMQSQTAQSIAAANKARIENAKQKALQARMPEGYTDADLDTLETYQKAFGQPLMGADGKYDIAGMGQKLGEELAKIRSNNEVKAAQADYEFTTIPMLDANKKAVLQHVRIKKSTGEITPVNGLDGKPLIVPDFKTQADFDRIAEMERNNTERNQIAADRAQVEADKAALAAEKAGKPKPLTEAQVLERNKALIELDRQSEQLTRVSELVNDKNVNPVGPMAGSVAGQATAKVAAMLGLDATKFNSQNELELFINSEVLANVEKMKGALSDRDILFLKKTAPTLSSDETVWNRYLATRAEILKKAKAAVEQGMDPTSVSFSGGASSPAAGTAGNMPPSRDVTITRNGAPTVVSAPEMPAGFLPGYADGQPAWVNTKTSQKIPVPAANSFAELTAIATALTKGTNAAPAAPVVKPLDPNAKFSGTNVPFLKPAMGTSSAQFDAEVDQYRAGIAAANQGDQKTIRDALRAMPPRTLDGGIGYDPKLIYAWALRMKRAGKTDQFIEKILAQAPKS